VRGALPRFEDRAQTRQRRAPVCGQQDLEPSVVLGHGGVSGAESGQDLAHRLRFDRGQVAGKDDDDVVAGGIQCGHDRTQRSFVRIAVWDGAESHRLQCGGITTDRHHLGRTGGDERVQGNGCQLPLTDGNQRFVATHPRAAPPGEHGTAERRLDHRCDTRAVADELGPVVEIHGARVLVGTCSWTDATLVKETEWYPKKSMKAAERLAYYSARYPIVEADSTYYFPPTPELAAGWAERTPEGFTMNVKAYSLLTGHPTFPHSLWPDLQAEIRADFSDRRNLYAKHLTPDAVAETWERFRHALMPLHSAGKLGAILLQYPEWFTPKAASRREIATARERLPDYRLCVEYRNTRWLTGEECDRTLAFLEEHDVAFVCVDEPQGFASSMPPVVAATCELGVIRFHGHNAENWQKKNISAAERFRYRYDVEELEPWVPKIADLAESAGEVHVLMNNCYRDYAVDNANQFIQLLESQATG
jgi:uncharacterized protein YecE (DUF72 family)